MKTMLKAIIGVVAIWTVTGVAEAGTEAEPVAKPPPVLPLEQVVRVIYQSSLLPPVFHVVSDADSVSTIVGLIEFEAKEPCECAHYEYLKLVYADETIEMSIRNHCLDYGGNYRMPANLWDAMQSLRKREEAAPDD